MVLNVLARVCNPLQALFTLLVLGWLLDAAGAPTWVWWCFGLAVPARLVVVFSDHVLDADGNRR